MKRKSSKQSKLERDNRQWRQELIESVGHCQLPDCQGQFPQKLCVHEIGCGTGGRPLSYSRRLACLCVCGHCNGHRLTDYSLWPPERQAALQTILCAGIASPQEVLAVINFCRGRGPNAITWADCAQYLVVQLLP